MRMPTSFGKLRAAHMARAGRGDVNVLFAFVFLCLVVFLAFGVDMTLVLSKKAMLDSVLQNVREESVDTSMSLVAKNSTEPDRIIARNVAEDLRKAGFDGSVSVYFYEAPKSSIPADKRDTERIYAYQVLIDDTVNPVFAALFGVNEIHVPATVVVSSKPYSQIEIWRPPTTKSSMWALSPDAPASTMSYVNMPLSFMPGDIKNAVDKLLDG